MSSIQGISASTGTNALELRKLSAAAPPPPAPQGRDKDGDVDKVGAADQEKGGKIDIQA